MAVNIHPTAIVSPEAELDDGVSVGAYAVVGAGVQVGAGTQVGPHAVLEGPTRIGASNRMMVLTNATVFGTVNANRGHYASAVEALERADRGWLMRMISRRVDVERYRDAFEKRHGDIKVVLTFGGGA